LVCSVSCIRRALYNIENDLRFVQDPAGHASPTITKPPFTPRQIIRLTDGRYSLWMRKNFRRILRPIGRKSG